MTENEAIKEVMIQKLVCESMIVRNNNYFHKNDNTNLETKIKTCEIAIKALNEIQEYRKIGTVEECREAVGKQKPKKIKIKPWSPARCPSCDYELSSHVGDGYYKHPTFLERCPECGQKIDWSNETEKCS